MVLDGKSSQECHVNAKFSHVSYYMLMNFLMMPSVILLSMLMILLSIPSVIKHLICASNYNWVLNLNLMYKTLSTGAGSGCWGSLS